MFTHRTSLRRRIRVLAATGVLLIVLMIGACGGDDELVRQDYNAVIAPERCGGVSATSCAGYQFTPTTTASP